MRFLNFSKHAILMLFLLFTTLVGCSDDDVVIEESTNALVGEWTWIQSIGGFAGQTLTPANTMSTRSLTIDADNYQEFVNDSLVYETAYELEMDSIAMRIVFDTGDIVWYELEGDELQIREMCPDCFDHSYEKN